MIPHTLDIGKFTLVPGYLNDRILPLTCPPTNIRSKDCLYFSMYTCTSRGDELDGLTSICLAAQLALYAFGEVK